MHEALIKSAYKDQLVGHISRDSTAIEAREKPVKKPKIDEPKRKRGRPKKGEERPPKPPRRLELQKDMTLPEMLADLPK
ncbi:MAG: IS5/IS1182 family transposase, partial [Pseudomonadota bacterium]